MYAKIVLVFDGDDTLWPVEWQYSKAKAAFFDFLYEEFTDLMPDLQFVVARYFQISRDLFPLWGVMRGRTFSAMTEAYLELLEYFKKKIGEDSDRFKEILRKRKEHNKRIFELGDQPFDFRKTHWLEEAKCSLSQLSNDERFVLCLLTSYDTNVWRDKAKHLGVEEFFGSRVLAIPTKKTKQDFITVSGYYRRLHGSKFIAVGNGESDILPALKISPLWRGVYIPHSSSSPVFSDKQGESIYTPPPMDNDRVLTLSSIRDLSSVDFEKLFPKKK